MEFALVKAVFNTHSYYTYLNTHHVKYTQWNGTKESNRINQSLSKECLN